MYLYYYVLIKAYIHTYTYSMQVILIILINYNCLIRKLLRQHLITLLNCLLNINISNTLKWFTSLNLISQICNLLLTFTILNYKITKKNTNPFLVCYMLYYNTSNNLFSFIFHYCITFLTHYYRWYYIWQIVLLIILT